MFTYILTLAFCYLCWKIIELLYKRWCTNKVLAHIPLVDDHHWFFGSLHKINSQADYLRIFQKYIEDKKPRWFVFWTLFLYPNLVPVDPEAIQAALTANDVPKNHGLGGPYRMIKPWIGDGLLISGGSKWARNRRLLTPAFHFDILKPYVDVFNDTADIFLDKLHTMCQDNKSFDIMPLVSRATFHALLRCTMSYGDEEIQSLGDQHPYVAAIHRLRYHVIYRAVEQHPYVAAIHRLRYHIVYRVVNTRLLLDFTYHRSPQYKEFSKFCDYVHKFSADIVADRRKTIENDPTELERRHLDFVDILLTAKDTDGSGLTDEEIAAEVDTFMFEGHDTTASAVSWTLYALAKYPEMQDKVYNEVTELLSGRQRLTSDDLVKLPYTTCFIKEVLRMYSPVPLTSRKLDKPCVIDGMSLPAGQVIDIAPHFVHHNPTVWENHMEFRPERFLPENISKKHPFAFIPFSAGQRNCIGQHFAMNEIKVLTCRVIQRFRLETEPDKVPEPLAELVMGAKDGIILHVKDRDY